MGDYAKYEKEFMDFGLGLFVRCNNNHRVCPIQKYLFFFWSISVKKANHDLHRCKDVEV